MNNESDLPSGAKTDPPDTNQIQETNPMEVHHHSNVHSNKTLSGYFWEFLMLFLAVFCGFLAEYQLEHVIEHQREITLMHTLTDDLMADEKTLITYTGWRTEVGNDFDSLLQMLDATDPDRYAYKIYQGANSSTLRFGIPDINEGTIQQLKNAGGLRLIRNRDVVNAINKHYLLVTRMRAVYETERLLRVRLVEVSADVLDASISMHQDLNPEGYKLLSKEKPVINRYMNQILAARRVNQVLINNLDSTRVSGIRLKQLIEEKYHN